MRREAALAQARRGIAEKIAINKSVLTISRQPTRVNSAGETVPDPYGTPQSLSRVARVSREQEGPFSYDTTEAGIGAENLARFILFAHTTDIQEGDRFDEWTVGAVDPIRKYGGLIGYQAKLKEAE